MSLLEHLRLIPDPRKDLNKQHELMDVIFLAFSAVLSGATGWKSMEQFGEEQLDWLQSHGAFKNGLTPRRHCIAYIIKVLNTESLVNALCAWVNERREQSGKALIALDGKTLRGTVMQLTANLPLALQTRWPHIRSIIEVSSERTCHGKTSCDSRWYVSSLSIDAVAAAQAVRRHWEIENNLHWVLDVVFREDEMTISAQNGAAHVALFNRVALGIIKQHTGKKDSMVAKRRGAAWNPAF